MDKIKKQIIVEGEEHTVNRIVSLIRLLEYNGNIGHSALFWISLDGDGCERPKLTVDNLQIENGGYGELVYLSAENMYRANKIKEDMIDKLKNQRR